MTGEILQSVGTAVIIAVIFAFVKLFRDVDYIKTSTEPLLEWWKKTSLDALKSVTNPISERLTELGRKYIEAYQGRGGITVAEKTELIAGLQEILDNPSKFPPEKLTQASISLRFIESQERVPLSRKSSHHH